MTIAKIDRCADCLTLEFVDKNGKCEWCCETAVILYLTGMMQAATPPAETVDADKTEAA